ncbi:MAG TPA: hypothetical protein VEB66_11935 [Opitutaceae bacterium]|nr:hypothetical protein [Opitutaceae bacterium]
MSSFPRLAFVCPMDWRSMAGAAAVHAARESPPRGAEVLVLGQLAVPAEPPAEPANERPPELSISGCFPTKLTPPTDMKPPPPRRVEQTLPQ